MPVELMEINTVHLLQIKIPAVVNSTTNETTYIIVMQILSMINKRSFLLFMSSLWLHLQRENSDCTGYAQGSTYFD